MAKLLLLDGDSRRKAVDVIDRRLLHLGDELPGVGGKGFDVTPLTLGIDRVHRQRALAAPGGAAEDGHPIALDRGIDAFQVMLLRAFRSEERRVGWAWCSCCAPGV